MKTFKQRKKEKTLLIRIPEWVYVDGGEVSLRYRRPDGEWYESTFYPIDYLETFEESLTDYKKELVEEIEKMKIEKHANIPEVKDEEYSPGYLCDCSYTEAQCFNAGLLRVLSLLQKDKEDKYENYKSSCCDVGVYCRGVGINFHYVCNKCDKKCDFVKEAVEHD